MTLYDTRHNTADTAPPAPHAPSAVPTRFRADDGRLLDGTWHRPAVPPRGAALVAGAMATRSAFYAPFARWLAEQGLEVLTFDYRGSASPGEMRAERGDALRWAGDAASALEELVRVVPAGTPVTWVGHSLGGQVLPLARHDVVDRALLISSGSGWWRLNQPGVRRWAPLFWRVLAPAATRVAGYYPGRRLGLLGDLPPGVLRQWARWCLHEEYAGVDVPDLGERFARVTAPVESLSFTDDELLSGASMRAQEGWYRSAPLTATRVAPAELGVERIGHHGFLRPAHRGDWPALVLPHLALRG